MKEQLMKLNDPDYHESIGVQPKWRIGDSSGGGMNEIYPYYDADQCETILDDVCGVDGWGCEYREVAGMLFCSIQIMTESGMIEKADAGGARSTRKKLEGADKETFEAKTAATGAFVRAASRWGIGRHLDQLPKMQLKVESGVCITPKGDRLPNPKTLTDWCNRVNPATALLSSVYSLSRSKFDNDERGLQMLSELRKFIES
jgi:hypothetical protein